MRLASHRVVICVISLLCEGEQMKRVFLKRALVCLPFGLLFNVAIGEALATTRRVPADYPTIQQAINASVNGDTVLVAQGTYVENIDFLGKAITVKSELGPTATVVDGNQIKPVVIFKSGEGPASLIQGFTLQNGRASSVPITDGGGIYIFQSSPTVSGNTIINNSASFDGGGIAVVFSSPIIFTNTINN